MTMSPGTVFEPTALLERLPAEMLIGDRWRGALGGGRFVVEDPATERSLAHVPDGRAEDALLALEAAARAQEEGWAGMPPRTRAETLWAAFQAVVVERDELAVFLISVESGKPLAESQDVVRRANATPYGLVACLFTTDLDRAWRIADRVHTGMVGINRGVVSHPAARFGGTKHSGLGREGEREGIEEYVYTGYVLFVGSPVPIATTDVGATP